MSKTKNMGRKSHHVEDAQYHQNLNRLDDYLPIDQLTRPTLGK